MDHDILYLLNTIQESAFYLGSYLVALLYREFAIYSYFYINGAGKAQAVRLDAINCLNPSNPQSYSSNLV
jgi:hypothetical protein